MTKAPSYGIEGRLHIALKDASIWPWKRLHMTSEGASIWRWRKPLYALKGAPVCLYLG